MMDFEELLSEVLAEDAQVEPVAGMERRVMARVAAEARPLSRRAMRWAVAGAGLTLALAFGWKSIQQSVEPNQSRPTTVVARAPADGTMIVRDDRGPMRLRSVAIVQRGRRRVRWRRPGSVVPVGQVGRIVVMPIAIAPLAVEPLEIALLSKDERQRKGEVQ